jgi:hypothetical protein
MDFKDLKFKVTEVATLFGGSKFIKPPTPKQIEKTVNILNKDDLTALCKTDVDALITVINKYSIQAPQRFSQVAISYLTELYCEKVLQMGRINQFDEVSNRRYQINATKNEPAAYEMISFVDGIAYKKNTNQFENDYFIGKPDILHSNSVKEIKTVSHYTNFLALLSNPPSKDLQSQLFLYMDLMDCSEGELIFVATGICKEERENYLQRAKIWYENLDYSPAKVASMLQKAERNINFDHLPIEKRIKRFPYKKNGEIIRFAKTRVTSARNWLARFHEKYENLVPLVNEPPTEG